MERSLWLCKITTNGEHHKLLRQKSKKQKTLLEIELLQLSTGKKNADRFKFRTYLHYPPLYKGSNSCTWYLSLTT